MENLTFLLFRCHKGLHCSPAISWIPVLKITLRCMLVVIFNNLLLKLNKKLAPVLCCITQWHSLFFKDSFILCDSESADLHVFASCSDIQLCMYAPACLLSPSLLPYRCYQIDLAPLSTTSYGHRAEFPLGKKKKKDLSSANSY